MTALAERVLSTRTETVPRYTSYPSANHFILGLGPSLEQGLVEAVKTAESVSLYVHIPFCDRLCWFCGCHTKHTLRYEPVRTYMDCLLQEVGLWKERLPERPVLSRLHLGGGSPSLLAKEDLTRFKSALASTFVIGSDTEISIEIDPTDVKTDTIECLVDFGLTRASIGVQDFSEDVQRAINRLQSYEETAQVVASLRSHGIKSVNIDALYGLPLQAETRLMSTVEKVIELKPDRVALFGYAHVPWLKPHQKLIRDADLPDEKQRFRHMTLASGRLLDSGYDAIGIDHFALPHDRLAAASSEGRLRRNFQGYTDDDASVLLGLGASSITQFPGGYIQNEVATGQYAARVTAGELPLGRGLTLSEDDLVRAWLVERLMCDFAFSLDELMQRFGKSALPVRKLAVMLAGQRKEGLCELRGSIFLVPFEARPFVRIVASWFDAWIETGARRYSKAV